MKKEIISIKKTLEESFVDLNQQIEFEKSFKELLKTKKISKYEKEEINSKLNSVYTEESILINIINELVDRFNYLIDDNDSYYISEFDLKTFEKNLANKELLKIEKAVEDLNMGILK